MINNKEDMAPAVFSSPTHPKRFIFPSLCLALCAAAGVRAAVGRPPLLAPLIAPATDDVIYKAARYLEYAIFALTFIEATLKVVDLSCTRYSITEDKVQGMVNFFNRTRTEVLLSRIEAVQVDQSFMDRILMCGTVTISTGGTILKFESMFRPDRFRQELLDAQARREKPVHPKSAADETE